MSFELSRSRALPGIAAHFEEYAHPTGLRHVHVKREDNERAFVLMFPTPVHNDRGIPHILEHLALCGSERFPVRDPFFSMLRRSTASFINAMTGEDYTLYPFSTTNENDYWNLMSVYTDATFFPNLNRLDFMQEGWRDTLDENGDVVIQGVVYNEMLGALNSREARLEIEINRAWHQGQPQFFVSGGEPLSIPSLSHEELLRFHHEHYHPSRAILLTYGNFDAQEAQLRMEEMVVSRRNWEHLPALSAYPPATRSSAMREVALPMEGEEGNEHSLTLVWGLNNDAPDERLLITALNNLLLQDGSPIDQLVSDSDFCRPGPIGFFQSDTEAYFRFELHGLLREDIARARQLARQCIDLALQSDISTDDIASALRDFEFSERDAGSKVMGMPYGIGKLYLAGKAMLSGRDGVSAFDNTQALEQLRERLLAPGAVNAWVRQHLDREADVCVHGAPDPEFRERYSQALQSLAQERTQALTPERRLEIEQDQVALQERQGQSMQLDLLPGLRVEDLSATPRTLMHPQFTAGNASRPASLAVEMASNGQVYMGVSLDLSRVPAQDMRWVGLLVELSSSLGLGDLEWAAASQWRNQQAAGFMASLSTFQTVGNSDTFGAEACFDAFGLERDIPGMAEMLRRSIFEMRIDEKDRIERVVENSIDQARQSLSQQGGKWASMAATASLSPLSSFRTYLMGREGHAWAVQMLLDLQSSTQQDRVFEGLARAKSYLQKAPVLVRVADSNPQEALDVLLGAFDGCPGWLAPQGQMQLSWTPAPAQDVALAGKTSVQYMHQAWKAPDVLDPSAGDLAVLSKVLSMEFLHQAIRERGGAYGAGASYEQAGAFTMMSYRDPRLKGTLDDFENAVQWALSGAITQEMVNSAIIGVCRALDTPTPLAKGAQEAWSLLRMGMDLEKRQAFRKGVLGATADSVRRAAQDLFAPGPVARAGFINQERKGEAEQAGLYCLPLSPESSSTPYAGPSMK